MKPGRYFLLLISAVLITACGDDDNSEPYRAVVEPLRRLAETCDVFFLAGNRDFLLGAGFAQACGARLIDDQRTAGAMAAVARSPGNASAATRAVAASAASSRTRLQPASPRGSLRLCRAGLAGCASIRRCRAGPTYR